MASMRYVRGEKQTGRGKGRGEPAPSFSAGPNKWTSSRSNSTQWEGFGRGRSGRGFGSQSCRGRSEHARGRGRGGFINHSFVRGSVDSAQTGNLPSGFSGAGAGNGNKKWVRKSEENPCQVEGNNDNTNLEESGDNSNSESSDRNDLSKSVRDGTTDEQQKSQLEKRGRNKLVLKRDVPENGTKSSDLFQTQQTSDMAMRLVSNDVEMERRGPNKLSIKRTDDQQKDDAIADKDAPHFARRELQSASKASGSLTWKRQSKEISTETTAAMSNTKNDQQEDNYNPMHHPRKKSRFNPPVTGPRRIRLVQAPPKNNGEISQDTEQNGQKDASELTTIDETAASNAGVAATNNQKTLTDFCYQDTGRGRGGRGRGSSRGRGGFRGGRGVPSGGRSMGLVRVKPQNPTDTPICPTFRRGIPCNNPTCSLRHDVSSEASRPICVFFQRNGMCSKGEECPFRHVKVRWDAEICPNFERLGYCEDENCNLRHVTTKKPRGESSAPPRK